MFSNIRIKMPILFFFYKNISITDSKVLQFLSHPEALQMRLRTRTTNFCNSGVEPPKRIYQLVGLLNL